MIVVSHHPDEWLLLREGDAYFMQVATGICYQPFSIVVKLSDEHVAAISMFGKPACDEIAGHAADHWLEYEAPSDAEVAAVSESIGNWQSPSAS